MNRLSVPKTTVSPAFKHRAIDIDSPLTGMLQTETEPIAERDSHGPHLYQNGSVPRLDCRIESGNETAQPVARIERSAGQAHPVVTRVFFHISKEGAPQPTAPPGEAQHWATWHKDKIELQI